MPFPRPSASFERRTPRRRGAAAGVAAALGTASLTLTALAAAPASAHGSMGDPVSRVAQCYAEGPESPKSAACRAAVAAGGTQALYDWNGIRIGDANGRHQVLIPDGRLCSANNPEFKGLDLARADWPATGVRGGSYTFRYRVTAPHRGTFKVYLTKPGYDPARPLAWAELDLAHPVATATDPVASGGFYTFSGTLPERSGRQLLYAVWQRSDSPEALYSCSDVVFGGGGGGGTAAGASPAPAASAPTERQIEGGAGRSTAGHHGHGDTDASTTTHPASAPGSSAADRPESAEAAAAKDTRDTADAEDAANASTANRSEAAGASGDLAETGGDGGAPYVAVGGAAALAVGSADSPRCAGARRTAPGRAAAEAAPPARGLSGGSGRTGPGTRVS